MTKIIKIYRSVSRQGSVISAELVAEVPASEFIDLQDLAEQYEGDYAIVDSEPDFCEEVLA